MEISQQTKVLHHLFNTICIADWLEIQNIQNMKSSVIIHLFVKAEGTRAVSFYKILVWMWGIVNEAV